MKTFKNKVAVITGAGSGMGRYLAVLLAKDGADVCICDVNEKTLSETSAMLRKFNVAVSSHILDVSDKEAIEALPQKVIDQHGKVDMVFNNAGVTAGSHFQDMKEDNWDWVMGINFDGVINSTRAFIPHLVNNSEGSNCQYLLNLWNGGCARTVCLSCNQVCGQGVYRKSCIGNETDKPQFANSLRPPRAHWNKYCRNSQNE